MANELISTKEAASLLGVGTTSIKRWADEGRLASLRTIGGHRRFQRADVLRHRKESASSPAIGAERLEQWLALLIDGSDEHRLQARLLEARAEAGSWCGVAAQVTEVPKRIGESWAEGSISLIQEHQATERLSRGLAACAAQITVAASAPQCLLATAQNDDHTLGLSLAELCAREAGFSCAWAGARTPTGVLAEWIAAHPPRVLAISASRWSSDADALGRQHARLAEVCSTTRTALILGGEGAWPETPTYGHRLHDFTQLSRLLAEVANKERTNENAA